MRRTPIFVLFAFALLAPLAARAADKIGNCTVTGHKGELAFTPAVPGQLTVNVSLPAPAWLNGDTPDTVKDGFEYCLAANIAWRAGLDKVVLNNVGWDALIAAQGRNYDLALSEISITEERKKVADFSEPYFSSDAGVLVATGAPINETSIKNARIGVQSSTTGETFVSNVIKPTQPIKVFPDGPSLFTALAAKQIDAAVTDTSITLDRAAQSKGAFTVIGQYATGEQYGALLPKGSPNKDKIDAIIRTLREDGTLKQLAVTWLAPAWGADPTAIPYFKP
ncbi:MAG TPA: ABC transporter substrate-binding protein [Dongiaceae bacterium]|jgi:polar amino acid transport system substrate-binding protein|nr:ABC transporter substrate-binding protein [Dongiaceae bacterium]